MDTAYRFCPQCGSTLTLSARHGRQRPVCESCGYVVFVDPKVAVVALIADGGSVLLVRRGVEPKRGKWALPGGFVDADELPSDALRREVMEEVGLTAEVGALAGIYALQGSEGRQTGFVLAFRATAPAVEADLLAGDDVLEARWWPLNALPSDLAFESTRWLLAAMMGSAGALIEDGARQVMEEQEG